MRRRSLIPGAGAVMGCAALLTAGVYRRRPAAASTSLSQLRGYEHRLTAANAPVEDAVRVIRSQLGLPPPETS